MIRRRVYPLFDRPTQETFSTDITPIDPLAPDEMIRPPTPDTIRTSYITNSTIHGLAKIFTGVWWERITWFIALSICIGVVAHFTLGFYEDYQKHDVRTEIRMHTAGNTSYPAATICGVANLLDLFLPLCYKNITLDDRPCTYKNIFIDQVRPRHLPDITPHPIYPSCIVWNMYGNLSSRGRPHFIYFKPSRVKISIFFHSTYDMFNPMNLYDHLSFDPSQQADIYFSDIQHFTRLPHPHPSNCSEGQYDDNLRGWSFLTQQ